MSKISKEKLIDLLHREYESDRRLEEDNRKEWLKEKEADCNNYYYKEAEIWAGKAREVMFIIALIEGGSCDVD